jgi:hypothetical protein
MTTVADELPVDQQLRRALVNRNIQNLIASSGAFRGYKRKLSILNVGIRSAGWACSGLLTIWANWSSPSSQQGSSDLTVVFTNLSTVTPKVYGDRASGTVQSFAQSYRSYGHSRNMNLGPRMLSFINCKVKKAPSCH